jgi:hypothetical protein
MQKPVIHSIMKQHNSLIINTNVRFPYKFFITSFIWSWLIWTPLILASFRIIPISDKLLSILTIPGIMIGVFGPLAEALFALHKENGKGSARKLREEYLQNEPII